MCWNLMSFWKSQFSDQEFNAMMRGQAPTAVQVRFSRSWKPKETGNGHLFKQEKPSIPKHHVEVKTSLWCKHKVDT